MTKLEQAKQNYPPGTVFKSAQSRDKYTISENPRFNLEKSSFEENAVRVQIGTSHIWLYYNGKWAEIISPGITKKEENYSLFPI